MHIWCTHKKQLTVAVGNHAFDLLSDAAFLADWNDLYHACAWATPYQSKDFVCNWYHLYQNSYRPVIIKAEENGQLTGLLTLALPTYRKTSRLQFLVGAGYHDADYHTWITREADDGAFIKQAITALWKQFPQYHVMLKYVPAQTPLSWLRTSRFWEQRFALQPFSRPLMETNAIHFSKHTKKRLNHLKKLATFERVTCTEAFSRLLDEQIAHLFDFRQGAMFNKSPFGGDPANKKILVSLFARGLLHVTVLRVKKEVIAAVAVYIRENQAYLGPINCHSPLYANLSPGYSHFILLGQLLATEGITSFDFTPGYDPYKERLANRHEQVHQLVITQSRLYFYKRQLRKWVHHRLVQAGTRPLNVQLEIRKRLYLLQHRGAAGTLKSWLEKRRKEKQTLYRIDSYYINHSASPLLHKDNLADLLQYEQQSEQLTRWEFLAAAMHRFEQGEHCYTWSDGGRLLGCVWAGALTSFVTGNTDETTANGVCMGGFYCHPENKSHIAYFLKDAVAAIATDTGSKEIYASASSKETFMCAPLETFGFKRMKEKAVQTEKFNFLKSLFRLFGYLKVSAELSYAYDQIGLTNIF